MNGALATYSHRRRLRPYSSFVRLLPHSARDVGVQGVPDGAEEEAEDRARRRPAGNLLPLCHRPEGGVRRPRGLRHEEPLLASQLVRDPHRFPLRLPGSVSVSTSAVCQKEREKN